jgi:alpha-mannosidase
LVKPSNLVLAPLAMMALGPWLAAQSSAPWPADAASYRFHMIGQAHIDPVWLWPWREGLAVVHSTFRSALDRMKENPDFAFTASSAQFYEWVAENDPDMLREIRQRVEEGRWGVVGGWWVEPDVNIPSGESLVRQGLYGQLTLRRLVGRAAKVAYNPDSFGHPGTLAQILKLQGMNEYVFMRPMPREKTLPANLFWWEAPDGTRVLAYRIPISYNDEGAVRGRLEQILRDLKPPEKALMAFYGAGDHGGGATKVNLSSIAEIQKQPGAPQVVYSTPEKYFAEVRQGSLESVPVVTGDLQHHSVGCYTAESAMKKANRSTEIAMLSAEKLAAIGALAWGAQYPKDEFTSAWKKILFLQFHDSMAGTALPEHYETTAPAGYGYARAVAERALDLALQKLEWSVPATDPDSQYLLAFNLHPWEATSNLEYDLSWPSQEARVEDDGGRALPHQWIAGSTVTGDRKRLVFRATLPPFGYRQIRIRKGAGEPPTAPDLRAEANSIENQYLRVTSSPGGRIGILDKTAGAEVFEAAGAAAVVLDDPSDTWSHDVKAYDKQVGAFGDAAVTMIEKGPLRARMRVETRYGHSTLAIEWILYAGSPLLEARVWLDWHEQRKMLKFSFPVAVAAPRATYEIAYGNIVRETNGDEEPGQRWLDVSGTRAGGAYGLALVNDAKYGYSVSGSDLRLSVVRGAPYAHHFPRQLDLSQPIQWQDQGAQTFRMLLAPHRGSWRDADIERVAEEFTTPQPVIYQGIHAGSRGASDSFLAASPRHVIVTAIKRAEAGDGLVLRAYESSGQSTPARIDLRFLGKSWSGTFRPYEIKTLLFDPRSGTFREVNVLEE